MQASALGLSPRTVVSRCKTEGRVSRCRKVIQTTFRVASGHTIPSVCLTRPLSHSLIVCVAVPAMVTRGADRELLMSYGVMGGFMQPRRSFVSGDSANSSLVFRGPRASTAQYPARHDTPGRLGCSSILHLGRLARRRHRRRRQCRKHRLGSLDGGRYQRPSSAETQRYAARLSAMDGAHRFLTDMGHDARKATNFNRSIVGRGQIIQKIQDRSGRTVWAGGSDQRADGQVVGQI